MPPWQRRWATPRSTSRQDVTNEADIEAGVGETVDRFGRLDILFNNAGGPVGAPIDQLSQEHIDYGVALLLSSVILGTRYAIEPMKASGGGVIINNSSVAALRYRQGDILYSALKAAVTHYTKMAGIELAPARHPRQLHLSRRHRHADLLRRLGAGQQTLRTTTTRPRWRS